MFGRKNLKSFQSAQPVRDRLSCNLGDDATGSCASIRTAGLMFIQDVLIIILGLSQGLRCFSYNIRLKSLSYFNMSISVGVTIWLRFTEGRRRGPTLQALL
ncbi:hypothetical protein SAMN05216428_101215 [Nitrosospira sp. Nsp11]|nr:hypothetical protein SAMN05216428_101215 [Nitrosospira sp. Nsp11]